MKRYAALQAQVYEVNLDLVKHGLVTLTWGNASGIDRDAGIVAIKPSGVDYQTLKPGDMVLLDLDGRIVDSRLKPSSDAPTHLVLYRAFKSIGGVVHAHSVHATAFAQACRPIPCLGTTHADHFHGEISVTRGMTRREVADDYEGGTGDVVVERFAGLDPVAVPGVLVAKHGPFTWGRDAVDAVRNMLALETVAAMALATLQLAPSVSALPAYLLEKHFTRKHGSKAYYGQKGQ
jgi:L-ribulose-5-phosphate 4-epimerase